VRVNDRGPFHSERLIDLSYAAAVKLGFAERGTARVMVELADGTDQIADTNSAIASAPAAAPSPPPVFEPGQIYLQAGAFRDAAGAERLRGDLTDLVGAAVFVQRLPNDRYYRVRIGPVAQMSEATRLQSLIVGAAHPKPMIVTQ
jgi:peptidoglycan lytic transglycosylase